MERWLRQAGRGTIVAFTPAAGGCISQAGVLSLADGDSLFLKYHAAAPEDFYAAEAAGLDALRNASDLHVPGVIHAGHHFLLLDNLGHGAPATGYWERLAEGLAAQHAVRQAAFGFVMDTYCGLTRQQNPLTPCGAEFFARHRLAALGDQALARNLLEPADRLALDRLLQRLPGLVPEQPPVLVHGDLWSGNIHCDREGHPALIDPACYWGWAEAELAMTTLFGNFAPGFYRAYESAAGIARDWRERAGLYNLYHLLNHLLLFGGGYLAQVRSVLGRFAPPG